ncbi:hypothetical protein V5O48_013410 [Marasmius crinis-equi]|uniref:Uncharacterized protein n=1 Tax=Marasmius crinis-equi TaxID=585013 RepID=A0ABR3F054_9AGAR
MVHLLSNCKGERRCLDAFARQVTTLEPASSLATSRFENLDDEDKGLLHIAARVCPDICDGRECPDKEGRIHSMKLVVQEGQVMILNDDLVPCSACGDVLYTMPNDISACVLSGWDEWLVLYHRWQRVLETLSSSSSPSRYTSPSPDFELPEIGCLFADLPSTTSKKRPADESSSDDGEGSDADSSPSSPPPFPPAKRMRTGPGKGDLLSGSILRKFH